MDPISIGAAVAALIAKALDRAEDGAVDSAVKFGRRAVAVLRQRLAGDNDAETALDALVDAPDSSRRQKDLTKVLEARVENSPELLSELKEILTEAKAAGVSIGPIEQVAEGDGNVQNAGIVGSTVNIQQAPRPDDRS